MFLLKKLIAPLLFPLSLCLEILFIGLILLFFSQKQRLARILCFFGVLFLFLFSFEPFADRLLSPLEYSYLPLSDAEAVRYADTRWIVVLGGGSRSDESLPANGQLSSSSLARLTEGIRLHRLLPESKLLLSGGAVFDSTSNARAMAEVSAFMGVDQKVLTLDEKSRDTAEQAIAVKAILKNEKFFLVTSASHLPRSLGLFEKQGMRPIPAPADYLVKKSSGPYRYYPGPAGLNKSERAIYEYIGIFWGNLSGKI